MNEIDLEQAILELVARPGYQPVKPRVIARRLGVPKDEAALVKKTVKRLVRQGRLAYGSSHLVEPVGPADPGSGRSAGSTYATGSGRIVGVFRRMEGGYGFVRPKGTAPSEGRLADIYIPSRYCGDASTGDLVMVRLDRRGGGKRPGPRGQIVEVIERQSHRFVGTYFESGGSGYVEVDGTLFARPILVGDPGASGARADDKVVLEMVRFPTHFRQGEGVITEVLGPRGQPGVDTLSIIREFNLPDVFPNDALEEAHRQAERFDEQVPPDRLDATDLVVITIDPADARDFDDAISLERLANGNWRLGVHIADVAYFVQPKTALDREAYQRGTSVYLPDRVIPMLPEVISNSLASLQPGKVRYTKSVLLEFTAEGVRAASEIHRAAIKSRCRLNYDEVDQFLANPHPWRRKLGVKVCELLGRMHELAMILRKRRIERGALELAMPEVKIELDSHGRIAGAHVVENTVSHQIIEEFMLAANEAVAETLAARDIPFLRRIHEPPVLRKLKELGEFVAELGLKVPSLQSRFELQKLLEMVAGRPEEHAVNYALLRSLQRAVYSPQPEGHYALASPCYCHFTSPIRRYPDLTVHRLLDAVLDGKTPASDFVALLAVGEHCSEREQRAEAAERELTTVKLLTYLSQRIGEEMDAVITGVESFGLFAQGIKLPAEGLIHVTSLADDQYRFDRTTHTLAGFRSGNSFRLGDLVRVAVLRVDLDRRELDFRLIKRYERPPRPGMPTTRGKRRPAAKATRNGHRKSQAAGGTKASARKRSNRGKKPDRRHRRR